jgi:hypothetical protein
MLPRPAVRTKVTDPWRHLALGVLLRAKRDHREGRCPCDWFLSEACQLWCAVAQVDCDAYLDAVGIDR